MSVLDSVLRVAAGEYSPFRRKKFPQAKTYDSNGSVYYDSRGKAWTLEREHLRGKVTHERWIRAPEYDSKH